MFAKTCCFSFTFPLICARSLHNSSFSLCSTNGYSSPSANETQSTTHTVALASYFVLYEIDAVGWHPTIGSVTLSKNILGWAGSYTNWHCENTLDSIWWRERGAGRRKRRARDDEQRRKINLCTNATRHHAMPLRQSRSVTMTTSRMCANARLNRAYKSFYVTYDYHSLSFCVVSSALLTTTQRSARIKFLLFVSTSERGEILAFHRASAARPHGLCVCVSVNV